MDFFQYLQKEEFLPLISPEPTEAEKAAEFFISHGLTCLEIPLRSDSALETIALLKTRHPDLKAVAGTVLSGKSAAAAVEAGASALISPGWSQEVFGEAERRGVPYLPGVFTATEVQTALEFGCRYLKFFPAAAAGVGYLKALSAAFFAAGVRFMPTGGINHNNYRSFLELPSVFCVSGSDFKSVFLKDDGE